MKSGIDGKQNTVFGEVVGPTLSHVTRVNGFFSQEDARARAQDEEGGGSRANKSSCKRDGTTVAERYRYQPDKVCEQKTTQVETREGAIGRRAERMETNWRI